MVVLPEGKSSSYRGISFNVGDVWLFLGGGEWGTEESEPGAPKNESSTRCAKRWLGWSNAFARRAPEKNRVGTLVYREIRNGEVLKEGAVLGGSGAIQKKSRQRG